jgi:16S rRNA U516 pseudouridylate synthase RsuA-like enzyme
MEKTDSTLRLTGVSLLSAGVCSRRGAQEIFESGRVQVNGTVVREVGFRVGAADRVTLDGKVIRPARNKVYLALHKPSEVPLLQLRRPW